MLVFNSLDELKLYYHEESNTYVFNDDVTFEFTLDVDSNINANNIKAWDIKAYNINAGDICAYNINAGDICAYDINAMNINAGDISYYAVCFAYYDITYTSIQGRRDNHKHFVLDGEIKIKPKEKKTVTLELTEEQLDKVKKILEK